MSRAGTSLAQAACAAPLAEEIRAAAMSVFQRFASEIAEPGVDGALLWLAFNVLASPATAEELHEVASFVQSPRELIARAVEGGWIDCLNDRFTATNRLRSLTKRISEISQRNNLAWRETITRGESPAELDGTINLLLGELGRSAIG